MKVNVYTRPNCGACTASKKWLDRDGVRYTEAEITDEILTYARDEGITSAPIIIVFDDNDNIVDAWGGFVPHKLRDTSQSYKAQAIINKYGKEN